MRLERRREAIAHVLELSDQQSGVVLDRQLSACGLSRRAASSFQAEGWLRRLRPGAFAVGGSAASTWQEVVAAALLAGSGSVISHGTAARAHRLPHLVPDQGIEITVSPPRHPTLSGVKVHRFGDLTPIDVQLYRGLAVTTPARTLCDLAGRLAPKLLERVVDDGCVDGLWTVESIGAALDRAKSRSGRQELIRLLGARVDEARAQSHLEQGAVRILHVFQPFEVQYQVVLDGQLLILDIAWPLWKVAVECDGWSAHDRSRSRFDADRRRGNLLLAHGWSVAHYTSAMSEHELLTQVGRLLPARVAGHIA